MKRILEICIDSVDSGIIAERAGADRVELCDNLYEGGTTPSTGTILQVRKNLKILLNVIIRPRGGDFLYSNSEMEIMKEDIKIAAGEGADGIVLGILSADGQVDKSRTGELIELASPLPVTFHRAFDMTSNPFIALEDIIECGAKIILTAGHSNLAVHNTALLKKLVNMAGDRIAIMPGSGINENNIAGIINETGAQQFHLTGRSVTNSKMRFRKNDIFMGGVPGISEFERKVADEQKIRKIRDIIDSYE